MTMSKMSMTKKNDDSTSQKDEKDGKNIWPSFFKMTDDETGTQASKDTPSKKDGAAAKAASASR